MINIHTMTAQSPSFGMPVYGPTSVERVAVAGATGVQVWTCARIRLIGGMGLAVAEDTYPGTRAWRPSGC